MMRAGRGLIGGLSVLFMVGAAHADEPRGATIRPTFTISHETTRITEPLTADGWPDYFGALNQRLGEGVTAENNAVVSFYRALGPAPGGEEVPERFFELLGVPRPPKDGQYFTEFASYLADSLPQGAADVQYGPVLEHLSLATMQPWQSRQYRHVAAWLRANEQPLAVVSAGASRPQYFSPVVPGESSGLISIELPGVQQYRSLARALCARAMLRTAEGQTEGAWQDLLTCHRLGRLCGRGPTMIEGLVGIAIDSMAVGADLAFIQHSQPNAATLRKYLNDLDRLPPLPSMVDKLDVGERFQFLDSVLLVARGDEDAMQLVEAESATGRLLSRLALNAIDWDVVLRMGNDAYDRLVAALRKPDPRERNMALTQAWDETEALLKEARDAEALQKLAANAKNPRDAVSQLVARGMLNLLLPAITQTLIAEYRAEQRVRNLRLTLGLAAYRDERGRYPERLDQLSPAHLREVPQDVFTGEPLVYRREDRGYTLYSVGANGIDDGGRDERSEPPGDDLVIRAR